MARRPPLADRAQVGRTRRRVGHIARFVVFGLIGVFLTKAAIDYKPKDAIGLDGALQKLAQARTARGCSD